MDWERSYVVSPNLRFLIGESGALVAVPLFGAGAHEVEPRALEVLKMLARRRTLQYVHRELSSDAEIPRAEFEDLVRTLRERRLIVSAEDVGGAAAVPLRLQLFQDAMKQRAKQGGWARFPLVSPFPEQQPQMYYPGLEARTVHEAHRFPWLKDFDACYPEILDELFSLVRQRRYFQRVYDAHTKQGEWAACFFWRNGKINDSLLESCPKTAQLLLAIPETDFGRAFFSAFAPGTRLVPHCGVTNARLRAYVPLGVPDKCGFEVAGRPIEVREGHAFVFDDSFVHTAWNDGERPRFVLVFDFFHPDLSAVEIEVIKDFYTVLFGGSTANPNEGTKAESFPDWIVE